MSFLSEIAWKGVSWAAPKFGGLAWTGVTWAAPKMGSLAWNALSSSASRAGSSFYGGSKWAAEIVTTGGSSALSYAYEATSNLAEKGIQKLSVSHPEAAARLQSMGPHLLVAGSLPQVINEATTQFITDSCVVAAGNFAAPDFMAAELIGPVFLTTATGMVAFDCAKETVLQGWMLLSGKRIRSIGGTQEASSPDQKIKVNYQLQLPYKSSTLWSSMWKKPALGFVSGFVSYQTGKAIVARLIEADSNPYSIALVVGGVAATYLTIQGSSYLLNRFLKEPAPQTEISEIEEPTR